MNVLARCAAWLCMAASLLTATAYGQDDDLYLTLTFLGFIAHATVDEPEFEGFGYHGGIHNLDVTPAPDGQFYAIQIPHPPAWPAQHHNYPHLVRYDPAEGTGTRVGPIAPILTDSPYPYTHFTIDAEGVGHAILFDARTKTSWLHRVNLRTGKGTLVSQVPTTLFGGLGWRSDGVLLLYTWDGLLQIDPATGAQLGMLSVQPKPSSYQVEFTAHGERGYMLVPTSGDYALWSIDPFDGNTVELHPEIETPTTHINGFSMALTADPWTYCTAKVNSQSCTPEISTDR